MAAACQIATAQARGVWGGPVPSDRQPAPAPPAHARGTVRIHMLACLRGICCWLPVLLMLACVLLPSPLSLSCPCCRCRRRYVEDWNATGVSFKYDADTAKVRLLPQGGGMSAAAAWCPLCPAAAAAAAACCCRHWRALTRLPVGNSACFAAAGRTRAQHLQHGVGRCDAGAARGARGSRPLHLRRAMLCCCCCCCCCRPLLPPAAARAAGCAHLSLSAGPCRPSTTTPTPGCCTEPATRARTARLRPRDAGQVRCGIAAAGVLRRRLAEDAWLELEPLH